MPPPGPDAGTVEVLAAAAAGVDGIHADPPPEALAAEFGSSSIDIEVDYWHAPEEFERREVRSVMLATLHRALRDAGFEIPFPQRDVWMRSSNEPG